MESQAVVVAVIVDKHLYDAPRKRPFRISVATERCHNDSHRVVINNKLKFEVFKIIFHDKIILIGYIRDHRFQRVSTKLTNEINYYTYNKILCTLSLHPSETIDKWTGKMFELYFHIDSELLEIVHCYVEADFVWSLICIRR